MLNWVLYHYIVNLEASLYLCILSLCSNVSSEVRMGAKITMKKLIWAQDE